jgi:hypothetical protein
VDVVATAIVTVVEADAAGTATVTVAEVAGVASGADASEDVIKVGTEP